MKPPSITLDNHDEKGTKKLQHLMNFIGNPDKRIKQYPVLYFISLTRHYPASFFSKPTWELVNVSLKKHAGRFFGNLFCSFFVITSEIEKTKRIMKW